MDGITGTVCGICGWNPNPLGAIGEELQNHLNAHSKEDLIKLLLQQQQRTVGTGSTKTVASGSKTKIGKSNADLNLKPRVERDTLLYGEDYSAPCHSRERSKKRHSSRSLLELEPVNLIGSKSYHGQRNEVDLHVGIQQGDADIHYNLVPVEATFSVPMFTVETINKRDTTNEPPCNDQYAQYQQSVNHEYIVESYTDNSVASSRQSEDSLSQNPLQEESDNATSQTSIIKYIIDQTGKTNCDANETDEGWILPCDTRGGGSAYSTHPPINTKPSENGLGVSIIHSGLIPLNLMTDEEIPPQGEISEYEESNTSLVSEDSKLVGNSNSNAELDATALVSGNITNVKQKVIRRGKKPDGKTHQFLCYECPSVQKFKSLFELIGHKVKLHPSVIAEFTNGDNTTSSMPLLFHTPEDPINSEDIRIKAPKEFFCIYCDVTFDSKVGLARHMEIDHSDKPQQPSVFECNTCGKIFSARTNLRKHLLVHKERKHVCITCSKGFTSNFKLNEHNRVHTKIYPFKCEACGKNYRTPSLLNHHMKTVHVPDSEKPIKPKIEFFCGTCHKVLRSKRSYFCHIKTHRATPKKCHYCCETFGKESVLVRHIRITHDPQFESSESKDCPVCNKKLHPNSLIKHMRIHANEKPYPCQVCGKRFRTYANLSSHSWCHTNVDKPFKCRICAKSYLFRRTLEHHMLVHKRRTLHYVCNECGVRFTNKVNMKRHLDEHYSEKKYKCKTCGKAFQRNYYLLEHERIHTGLKPFVCNICGKASTTKSNHRAHIKIHDARDAGSQEG